MKKIVILAVALATRGTFAALVMTDTKEFFEGGAMLPGSVASCPSPSLRTAAVLPEIYGVLSAWMERTFLYYCTKPHLIGGGTIQTPSQMKTADLSGWDDFDYPFLQAMTNRVVTSRMAWWPLVEGVADAMKFGYPGATYNGGLIYNFGANSSTALGGQDFPTIGWTTNLIEAVSTNRWVGIWPYFGDCPTDGVWKTESYYSYPRVFGNESLIGWLYDGDFAYDYPELHSQIVNWKSPISCLDILREKIGDGAYALTNRTLRLDRNFLTALENALGLCDTYIESTPRGRDEDITTYFDLTYGCYNSASASASAVWRFNTATRQITIHPDQLTWTFNTYLSTSTNEVFGSDSALAWCGGSTESAGLIAQMNIPLTLVASDVYNLLIAQGVDPTTGTNKWTVTADFLSGGNLVYELESAQQIIHIHAPVSTGTNTIYVGASANQNNRVIFTKGVNYRGDINLPLTKFYWIFGFIDHVDVALGKSCFFYNGYAPWYPGWIEFPSSRS